MANLQVRDVPVEVHETLKDRAARAGMSLSEYALSVLERDTRLPTLDEMVARIAQHGAVDPGVAAAEILRAERNAA
ncbi:MAG: hypothetical protein QM607_05855 [Microbacterium sp.]